MTCVELTCFGSFEAFPLTLLLPNSTLLVTTNEIWVVYSA